MVYNEIHIYPYLFFDQNANDNAYSTPLLHEVCNVDHKMIVLGIGFYIIHSHMLVCNIGIILNRVLSVCPFSFLVFFCPDQTQHSCGDLLSDSVEML